MTTRVVYQPERKHSCGPNRYGIWEPYVRDRDGTVRQCEQCGTCWVAYRPLRTGLVQMYVGALWRREGWFERWRRQRRARRPVRTEP